MWDYKAQNMLNMLRPPSSDALEGVLELTPFFWEEMRFPWEARRQDAAELDRTTEVHSTSPDTAVSTFCRLP